MRVSELWRELFGRMPKSVRGLAEGMSEEELRGAVQSAMESDEFDGFEKMDEIELYKAYGLRRGGVCYCLHCDRCVSVSEVLDNSKGDFCPTPTCDGGGWGIDLYPHPWWRGQKRR